MGISFYIFFLLIFLVRLLVSPTRIIASCTCNVKQLTLLVFGKCPIRIGYSHRVSSDSGQIRTNLDKGVFQGVKISNSDNALFDGIERLGWDGKVGSF